MSPLAVAAARGHEDTVCVLLEQDDINFEQRGSNDDRTVLSHSSEDGQEADGQEAIATRFSSQGADPNLRDSVGRSPLFFAAAQGHTRFVNILLEHGAEVNQVDQKHSVFGHDSQGGQTVLFTPLTGVMEM
jgi:ankyrin repeat protein